MSVADLRRPAVVDVTVVCIEWVTRSEQVNALMNIHSQSTSPVSPNLI